MADDRKRVWVDEDDFKADKATPAFLKQSHQTPTWAVSDAKRDKDQQLDGDGDSDDDNRAFSAKIEAAGRKRFRSEDLDALLSKTEPLLSSKHDRQHMAPPSILSILPLPRDGARTVQWHRNGQLCLVGGNHHLYTFHAAGKFVEQLSKIDVEKRIEQSALTANGEDVLVATHEAYIPLMVSLATEQVTPLNFLDTRDSAVHRNGRRDNSKRDFYVSRIAARPDDAVARMVAVASGSTVRLGAMSSGSVVASLSVEDLVTDLSFSGPNELTIAAGNKLTIYDIRKTARFLHSITDDGALHISSFAVSSGSIATGSAAGVVSLYSRDSLNGATAAPAKPIKVLKNLTTAINNVCFGVDSNGESVLAFASKGQKAAFRLAQLPQCQVIPSFPAVSSRHEFPQALAIAPSVPILSIGERGRVVNYAL